MLKFNWLVSLPQINYISRGHLQPRHSNDIALIWSWRRQKEYLGKMFRAFNDAEALRIRKWLSCTPQPIKFASMAIRHNLVVKWADRALWMNSQSQDLQRITHCPQFLHQVCSWLSLPPVPMCEYAISGLSQWFMPMAVINMKAMYPALHLSYMSTDSKHFLSR